jgi:hypothetical protein
VRWLLLLLPLLLLFAAACLLICCCCCLLLGLALQLGQPLGLRGHRLVLRLLRCCCCCCWLLLLWLGLWLWVRAQVQLVSLARQERRQTTMRCQAGALQQTGWYS